MPPVSLGRRIIVWRSTSPRSYREWLAQIHGLDVSRSSLSGHSMGGHGAMTLAFKNPGAYRSVSAFSPICAPASCPWGHKAFTAHLGSDEAEWKAHDASELILAGAQQIPVLIDQGGADGFPTSNWGQSYCWLLAVRPASKWSTASRLAMTTAITSLLLLSRITCVFTTDTYPPNGVRF